MRDERDAPASPGHVSLLRPALAAACWVALLLFIFVFHSTHTDRYSVYATDVPLWLITGALATLATLANFDAGRRFLRRVAPAALLLLGSTLLSLGALEIFLRVVDLYGLSTYSEMSRYILDRLPDPELKYRHRRSWASTYQGVELRFNEAGLRDAPIEPKAPSEFRVLALGDSQTLGWGVAQRFIWTTRLQDLLAEKLRRPVRVINAGCASYETRQERRYLKSDGWGFNPDLILLLYMDNDLEISDDPYDPWSEKSLHGKSPGEILYLLGRKLRVAQLVFYAKTFLPLITQPQYGPQQFGTPFAADPAREQTFGWKTSMESLRAIRDDAQAHGARFAVVHFDWIPFPFSQQLDDAVRDAVAPSPVAYTAGWFPGPNVRQYFNSRCDAHPNAEGHRILAERIADFIVNGK